jgi:hypothetical protein
MIALALILLRSMAHAADLTAESSKTLDQIEHVNRPQASCPPGTPKTRKERCEEKMTRLYRDQKATIDVFLGYSDTSQTPATTTNMVDRAYLVQKLYQTCGSEPCGFRADPANADLIKKTKPDGNEVIVQIHSSALSDRDDLNRKNPDQKKKTEAMNARFKSALKSNEAVFYIGHSRAGGGPDFGPPQTLPDGHTDYDWYQKHRPGLKMIEESMSPGQPDFYGSFSCDSLKHFTTPIRKVNPDVLYFGTTRITSTSFMPKWEKSVLVPDYVTTSEVLDSALVAIGGIADRKCAFNDTFKSKKIPAELNYD